MSTTYSQDEAALDTEKLFAQTRQLLQSIDEQVSLEVIGQENLKRRLLTALIANGHILLEGVPGLAKTRAINSLAKAIDGEFKRIQFTPDLLPADLIGTEIYRPNEGNFVVRKGPVFANFVLADEINRAPAKVQSALLETMQERQVTIGDQTLILPSPFLVLATQNPVEQEGTYSLPEAQVDRFLMKVKVDYPSPEDEKKILSLVTSPKESQPKTQAAASLDDVLLMRKAAHSIYVDERLNEYMVRLTWATRKPEEYGLSKIKDLIELGASPRAGISLFLASRAEALIDGNEYVIPQTVKDVAKDVLRHRIILSYEAEAQGIRSDDIIQIILDGVEVP